MNYIAHIQIGAHTQTHLLGNFLGDFVKGSNLAHLPKSLSQGIRLHRSVDVYTDVHPAVKACKQRFPKGLRRLSGVVLDIYFDYLLMQNWPQYSDKSSEQLFEQFYQQLKGNSLSVSQHFDQVATRLIKHRWLDQYQYLPTCFQAMLSIEKRLNNKVQFAQQAKVFIDNNSEFLESSFHQFYPDCLKHAEQFIQRYNQ